MITGRELQKKVSGHFAHYSDEEMNNCCVGLEIKITVNTVQRSRGSAFLIFIFGDKYFLLSLGTICETPCF